MFNPRSLILALAITATPATCLTTSDSTSTITTVSGADNICFSAPYSEYISLYSAGYLHDFICPTGTPCTSTSTDAQTSTETSTVTTVTAIISTSTLTTTVATTTSTETTATVTITITTSTITNTETDTETETTTETATSSTYLRKRDINALTAVDDETVTTTLTRTTTTCPLEPVTCTDSKVAAGLSEWEETSFHNTNFPSASSLRSWVTWASYTNTTTRHLTSLTTTLDVPSTTTTSTTFSSPVVPTTTTIPTTTTTTTTPITVPSSLTNLLCSCIGQGPQPCGTVTATVASTSTDSVTATASVTDTIISSVTATATTSVDTTTTESTETTMTSTTTTTTTTTTTVTSTNTYPAACTNGPAQIAPAPADQCTFDVTCGQIVASNPGTPTVLTLSTFGECFHQCDADGTCWAFSFDGVNNCVLYEANINSVLAPGGPGSGSGRWTGACS